MPPDMLLHSTAQTRRKTVNSQHTSIIEGRNFDIEFHWIPHDEVENIAVYPTNAAELLNKLNAGVQHFVYREG